ncbi:Lrp/AsnC family transcriptional regulator [Lutibacter aestuarii]|uniref:Lrp/AsnC family transcriptional regulator n=1 Tax=Lutibacter aestuarii TaxID=861111 RepID=A0ABW2Z7J7_9FLAO|nr:Lrp/AsnC family transcriptional regulator [uncultured Lutibacter sp.]
MTHLDDLDKKILNLLQQNSKANIKEIALKIGLTQTPTYERIKRLEKNGYIEKYVAILNKEKIGFHVEVFCQVTLLVHSKDLITKFELAIHKIDEVVECFHVAGNYDYLLKIIVKDMNTYQNFLKNKLSVLDSVANVQSTFVMTSTKKTSILKLT